ncbi:MAG: DegV family protein [Anaerolineae bacterium]|nr:DegV family protein [Anaerolineae bacterium]
MPADPAIAARSPLIVTDSTCDLPAALYAQYGIQIAPLKIMFGEESYRSNIDMLLPAFAERLARGDVHPTTSQPTVHEFKEVYEALAEQERPILSIHVSDGLSGTVNVARQAAQQFPDLPITVHDSRTISAALGMQVLAAARASEARQTVEQIVPLLERTHAATGFLFTLDDLSFLVRGGRIGAVQYTVASALSIKPIITVSKKGDTAGTYISAGRTRSLEKAVGAFVKQVQKDVPEGSKLRALLFHGVGRTPGLIEKIKTQLQAHYDCVLLESDHSTPVLGVHVGPLALDMAYAAGDWEV